MSKPKVNMLNVSFNNPFSSSTVIDLALAKELLQPYLEKGILLVNCNYCSNIHRLDSWCSCEEGIKDKKTQIMEEL